MKNRGVFITIILILVLGAGITFRMHQFVTENSSPAVLTEQEAAEEDAEETVGAAESPVAADLLGLILYIYQQSSYLIRLVIKLLVIQFNKEFYNE